MDEIFSFLYDILDNAEFVLDVFIIGIVLFLVIGRLYISFIVNYPNFFKSSKCRKKFFKDVKTSIIEKFTTKRERTFRILFFTALIVACLCFAVYTNQ